MGYWYVSAVRQVCICGQRGRCPPPKQKEARTPMAMPKVGGVQRPLSLSPKLACPVSNDA